MTSVGLVWFVITLLLNSIVVFKSKTQLNEAEYAPLLTAVLLYLNSEGVAAPLASTLAVGGQVIYFWLRAFVGHYHEGGMDPPPYAPFAVVRYVALGLLVQELRGLTA